MEARSDTRLAKSIMIFKSFWQRVPTIFTRVISGSHPIIFSKNSQLDSVQDDKFSVFISYRHSQPDQKLAKWLHVALEHYRVPKRLMHDRDKPRRIGRVFRDEEELAVSPDLSAAIEQALQRSEYLVVVCSPRTPASQWVNKEIERFRALGRGDRILALLIEGEPSEAFPPALYEIRPTLVGSQNGSREKIEALEPLAADVRPVQGESIHYRKRMAKLRLLAAIVGCRFDELRQREQERRTRNLSYLTVGLVLLITLVAGLGLYAELNREAANKRLEIARDAGNTLVSNVVPRLRTLAGLPGTPMSTVQEILMDTEKLFDRLMQTAPDSPDLQDRKALMLIEFAETYASMGQTNEQLKRAGEARDIMDGLVAQDPNNSTWKGDYAESHCTLGNAKQAQGDLTGAVEEYKTGKELLQKLVDHLIDQDPSDKSWISWQGSLMACSSQIPVVLHSQGDLKGELEAWQFMQSMAERLQPMAERLNSQGFDKTKIQKIQEVAERTLTAAHSGVELALAKSDPARAVEVLRRSQALEERLSNGDPYNPRLKSLWAETTISIADFLWLQRNLNEALEAYRAAQATLEPFADHDRTNTEWQYQLVRIYQGEGQVLRVQNNLDGALKVYDHAGEILRRLIAEDSENIEWVYKLALNYMGDGYIRISQGNLNQALADFQFANQRLEPFLSQVHNNAPLEEYMMSNHDLIGKILLSQENYDGALEEYKRKQKVIDQMANQDPNNDKIPSLSASNLENIRKLEDFLKRN